VAPRLLSPAETVDGSKAVSSPHTDTQTCVFRPGFEPIIPPSGSLRLFLTSEQITAKRLDLPTLYGRTVLAGSVQQDAVCNGQRAAVPGHTEVSRSRGEATVLREAAPCGLLEVYRCFGGACCFHYQGEDRRRDNLKSHRSRVKFHICCAIWSKWKYREHATNLGHLRKLNV
jgi:hypothetical protein